LSNSEEFAKEIMKERGLKGAKTRRLIEKIIKTMGTDKQKINVALKRAQIGHSDSTSENE